MTSLLKIPFIYFGLLYYYMQDFPLVHSWWTVTCVFPGSMKELTLLNMLRVVLWPNWEKEICTSEGTHSLPSHTPLLMSAVPQQAGISFSCGSYLRAPSSSLGTPGSYCVICWSLASTQRASVAIRFLRSLISLVLSFPLSPTGNKTRTNFCLIKSAPLLSKL